MNADELWSLDTRHLSAMVAIARTRSISRAADELGYGQSAVSQQLASLERVVGQRLVDRGVGPRPVSLTAAGAAFLPHAQWIVERLGIARRELADLDSGHSGRISIGTFQSVGARLLPSILAEYRRRWPDVEIALRDENPGESVRDLLREGVLDVAFLEGTDDLHGLANRTLLEDRFVAVVPVDHRLASRKTISLTELNGEPLIGGLLAASCTQRSEGAMHEAGVEFSLMFRTDDNTTRQRMVHAGLGCAVQPGLTVDRDLVDGGVVLALREDVSRTIVLAWSDERTPSAALTRFIECATAVPKSKRPAEDG